MPNLFCLDYVNGNDANTGVDWAHAWQTITNGATAARIAPGDLIKIAKSPNPVSIGNATWNNLSKTVTLASAQTLLIDRCEVAWTAVNGSVTRQPVATDGKENAYCMQITEDATPGADEVQAYYPTGLLDLSGYQKISFWLKNEVAIPDNTRWVIKLYTTADASGVAVDEFVIPAIPSTGKWIPLTIARTGGGNLNNAIQSIALCNGAGLPTASKYVRLDNIIACTTDGLNLQSLISKNSLAQGGAEGWYGIQSINGVTVLLDNETNTKANAGRGYFGTTETVATYKRETTKTALASLTAAGVQIVGASGSLAGGNIQFQGGYNTVTDMQDGETFFDGLNGIGYGIYITTKDYITFGHINMYRYYDGLNSSGGEQTGHVFNFPNMSNNQRYGAQFGAGTYGPYSVNIAHANNNGNHGVYIFYGCGHQIAYICANNNLSAGIDSAGGVKCRFTFATCNNNQQYGFDLGGSYLHEILGGSTSSNGSGGITPGSATFQYFRNFTCNEATKVGNPTYGSRVYMTKYAGDVDDNRIFTDGGSTSTGAMFSQTTTRHTASGIAWQLSPLSTRLSNYPLKLSVAKIAVEANKLVTVKAWMKKDHATNVACSLVCPGKQISGVDNDVAATKANDTNWEQLTITFTPTERGVVEIEAWAWYVSGNSNAYIDDLEISQA